MQTWNTQPSTVSIEMWKQFSYQWLSLSLHLFSPSSPPPPLSKEAHPVAFCWIGRSWIERRCRGGRFHSALSKSNRCIKQSAGPQEGEKRKGTRGFLLLIPPPPHPNEDTASLVVGGHHGSGELPILRKHPDSSRRSDGRMKPPRHACWFNSLWFLSEGNRKDPGDKCPTPGQVLDMWEEPRVCSLSLTGSYSASSCFISHIIQLRKHWLHPQTPDFCTFLKYLLLQTDDTQKWILKSSSGGRR